MHPWSSTTAIPSESASNAVSHCSLACCTIWKNRALAITIAACVATVESSRMSSGGNVRSRGFAITSVPTTTPCARNDTAAAESTATSPRSRVGSPLELRTSSSRSRLSERTTRPESVGRSEEHTSELQSLAYLVCRLLLEKKKKKTTTYIRINKTKVTH